MGKYKCANCAFRNRQGVCEETGQAVSKKDDASECWFYRHFITFKCQENYQDYEDNYGDGDSELRDYIED